MISGKVVLLCAFTSASVAYVLPPRDNVTHADVLEEDSDIDLIEGDMILTEKQRLNLFSTSRNGLIDEQYRWPEATVIYYISKKFDDDETAMIDRAIRAIAKKSCIKFVERTSTDEHYVLFTKVEKGCYSHVGYQYNLSKQKIGLSSKCFLHYGSVLHEILHTLGFYHMHSSFDRDDYVTILLDNIKEDHVHNFKKYSDSKVTHFGLKYDYNSVMHYSSKAFSKNGEDTIVPKEPEVELGQRRGLSKGDKKRMNLMYNC